MERGFSTTERSDPYAPVAERQGALLGASGFAEWDARRPFLHATRLGPGHPRRRTDAAAEAGRWINRQSVLFWPQLAAQRYVGGCGWSFQRRHGYRPGKSLRFRDQYLDPAAGDEQRSLVSYCPNARQR